LKIYNNIKDFKPVSNPVVTVGTFDGVHIGHQKIFKLMQEKARKINGETVIITFNPHPRLVIHPNSKDLKFINTQERKLKLIGDSGIDHLIVIPFTKEFSNTPSSDFVKKYIIEKTRAKVMVIGYDHHFGKDRQGSYGELKGLGKIFKVEIVEVDAQKVEGLTVSSTKIRKSLIMV